MQQQLLRKDTENPSQPLKKSSESKGEIENVMVALRKSKIAILREHQSSSRNTVESFVSSCISDLQTRDFTLSASSGINTIKLIKIESLVSVCTKKQIASSSGQFYRILFFCLFCANRTKHLIKKEHRHRPASSR